MKLMPLVMLGLVLVVPSLRAADDTRGLKLGILGYGIKLGAYSPGKSVAKTESSDGVPIYYQVATNSPPMVSAVAATNSAYEVVAANPAPAFEVVTQPAQQPVAPAPQPVAIAAAPQAPVTYAHAPQAQQTYTWTQAPSAPVTYAQQTWAQPQSVSPPAPQIRITRINPVITRVYVASR